MTKRASHQKRNERGATLTEMLVASLLLGFTFAAIGEVMVLTTLSANRMNNRAAGINDTRTVTSRIQRDIREARNFGDSYDSLHTDDQYNSNYFPCTTNLMYDPASGPQFTSTQWSWSGWPTTWGNPPYQLDAQTLIIQQPKIYENPSNISDPYNGLPVLLNKDKIAVNEPPVNMANLDTVVYKLIQDPNESSEYILQRARFVGVDNVDNLPVTASFKSMINPPQTVLTGIIGPKPAGGGGVPEIFTYFERDTNNAGQFNTISATTLDSTPNGTRYLVGVGVDVELKKPDSSTGNSNAAYQQRLGIHTESFLRHSVNLSAKN